ncbi:metalloregulator ArsR/SmtB family transcription factor [Arthrobacter globiformis]|uniref:ArsR/SmtB family transcription factor n=1 Tax=Arthrobacter globiformis TaxID=1665 RepID=UPI00397E7A93
MVTDDVFAVIAEATRRDILVSLQSGDKAVGELVEELAASQPTISKHLKVLREADLVSMRAQGQKRYYALNPKPLAGVANWLETFDVGRAASAGASPDAAPQQAEDAQAGTARAAASAATQTGIPGPAADVPDAFAAAGTQAAAAHTGNAADDATHAPGRPASGQLSPAVVVPGGQVPGSAGQDDTVPQQIGRTVGRAATKAADLLANLPKFGRKK